MHRRIRAGPLQTHFGQASRDIDDILVSSGKVTKRSQKIEALEFGPSGHDADEGPGGTPRSITGSGDKPALGSGQLKLRVVDEGD